MYAEILISVFKIVEWVDKKTSNIHLFVGENRDYSKLLLKLKNNSITDKEEDTLKKYYKNYNLLKKCLQKDENVNIIYQNIYEDDTIYTMKNKLCMYTNNDKNHEHLYLWYKRHITNLELLDILNNIFNKNENLKVSEINEIFINLFEITELKRKNKRISFKEVYDILKNKFTKIYSPLELNYYNENRGQKFINSNPCKKISINEKFVTEDGDYIPLYEYKLDSFSILKSKWNENDKDKYIINYIVSEDVLELANKNFKKQNKKNETEDYTDDLIFNGYLKQYFPYLNNLKKINDYNDKNEEVIKELDEKIKNIYSLTSKEDLFTVEVLVNRIHFKVSPILVNNNFNKSIYNLETLFNYFELTEDMPFIIYRKNNNNLYKINKNSLGNKFDTDDKKIDQADLEKWTNNSTSRKMESIIFKIFLYNTDSGKTKYYNFILSENGEMNIIFDLKFSESIEFDIVINKLDKLSDLIKLINNELNTELIIINKDILYNTNLSYVEFKDFITINTIIYKKEINEKKKIIEALKYSYPFFDIIEKNDQLINIKYKKTNNYYNLDDVGNYILQNSELDGSDMVSNIMEKFKLNKKEAKKEYEEKKEILRMNLMDNNLYKKSKLHPGIFIKLNIKNLFQIQYITKNLQNINDNKNINKLLELLVNNSNNLIKKKINKKEESELSKMEDKLMESLLDKYVEQEKEINTLQEEINSLSNNSIENINIGSDIGDEVNGGGDTNSSSNDEDDFENFDEDIFGEEDFLTSLEGDDEIISLNAKNDVENIISTLNTDDGNKKKYIKKEKEYEIEPGFDIDLSEINDVKKKKKYNQLILKRLQWADKELFGYTLNDNPEFKQYSRTCGSTDKRQPIVLTKNEIDIIDKKYRDSYTSFIKTGSTKNNMEKNYYICPRIWCPLSKVSLSEKDLEKNKGKCPDPIGEPPLILDAKNNYWKKQKGDELINVDRYPNFLKKELHPKGFEMPCCGKKESRVKITDVFIRDDENKDDENKDDENKDDENKDDENKDDKNYVKKDKRAKKINDKYIRKIENKPVEPYKYATLPNNLSNILGNIGKCHGLINNKTNCYVRRGIEHNNQYFISCLIDLCDDENINSLNDFYEVLEENMTPIDYISLNNGNTLKLYINDEESIFDNNNFKNFKEWILNDKNKEYVKLMNLTSFTDYLKNVNSYKYEYDEDNKYNNVILREYMIYNSFMNFKYYIKSNLIKNHEELLQLFMNNKWLNLKKHNIVLLNSDFENGEDKIELLCSKFTDYKNNIDFLNNFIFILKIKKSYEPIVKITFRSSEIIEKKNFNYFEDIEFKNIINYHKNNCNNKDLNKYINPITLYNALESLEDKYNIRHIVINMSFNIAGFIIVGNLFIPLDNNIFSINAFNKLEHSKNYIYLQDIQKYKCNLTEAEIRDIFDNINKAIKKDYYIFDNSDVIKNENKSVKNRNVAIILKDGMVIPLYVTREYEDKIKNNLDNEFIFTGFDKDNEQKIYTSNYFQVEQDYNNKLKKIIKNISINPILIKKISNLKNPFNPFSKQIKINKIKEIVKTLSKNNNMVFINTEIDNITSDIFIKDIEYILRLNNKKLKLKKNEIVYDQNDIIEDKLNKLLILLKNPYKFVQNSIEDYINYIPIILDKNLVEFKFITDDFKNLPYRWEILGDNFYINKGENIPGSTDQDTMNYILKIFNKIAELNNIKTNEKNMINYINTERKKDFGKIKDKFVNENKLNPHFKMKYEILFPKEEDVSSFSSIQEIFDNSNYKYGFYELQKLSKLTKINTILLGNKIGNRIPDDNGMRCFYNKSNIYLLLNIDPVKDYDKYNIIIKNRQKILFNYDDFNKSFKETIIDRKCKGEVIDNNDN
jgi:hypothetical protein